MSKKAIILFSGGLDSTTCLALAKQQGFDCYALTFDYGQKHKAEIIAAQNIAKQFQVAEHKIFALPLNELGGSALTDPSLAVPDFNEQSKAELTYVPARNLIFLSIATAWAETLNITDIFVGGNKVDHDNFPDCRAEFYSAMEIVAHCATKMGEAGKLLRIHTPFLHGDKKQIIETGINLGIDYGITVSCYRLNSKGEACGNCSACELRKQGFMAAGVSDPTQYTPSNKK